MVSMILKLALSFRIDSLANPTKIFVATLFQAYQLARQFHKVKDTDDKWDAKVGVFE